MRFKVTPISKALLRPRRSHSRPAGKATSPVAIAPTANMLPMKSGSKPTSFKFRYRLNMTPQMPKLKPCNVVANR